MYKGQEKKTILPGHAAMAVPSKHRAGDNRQQGKSRTSKCITEALATGNLAVGYNTKFPMDRCLCPIHHPSLGALSGGWRRRQTHVHGWELPLRWDLLSQGRGLFLKQTLPRPPTDV